MIKRLILLLSFISFPMSSFAGDGHEDHHNNEEKDHDDDAHSKSATSKGIVEANEKLGIKLSAEALKTFALKTTLLRVEGPWTLPIGALLYSGEEINLFRYRDGYYKRVDFTLITKAKDRITVKSKDLKAGDEVVVSGLGFLRIAEIAAFGGAPEDHPH